MGTGYIHNQPSGYAGKQRSLVRVNLSESKLEYVRAQVPVPLAGGASIVPDYDAGNIFDLTLTASTWTLQVPSFAGTAANYDGARVTFRIRQDGTGGWTLAWGAGYRFSAIYVTPVISVAPGVLDYYGFQYNNADTKWDLIAQSKGY